MSLRFKNANLRPVLAEAAANRCHVVLVKDQGVYFLAERGERRPDGRQKLVAYAVGCNPDVDPFNAWWEQARVELGGDDFAEYFDPQDRLFARIQSSEDDLELSATQTHLSLQTVDPRTRQSLSARPTSPRHRGLFFAQTWRLASRCRMRSPAGADSCSYRQPPRVRCQIRSADVVSVNQQLSVFQVAHGLPV